MKVNYLPPFGQLRKALSISVDGETVTMSNDIFKLLLAGLARAGGFNPKWYRASYPDVEPAIRRGEVADELAHFAELGYAEGRLPGPMPVDHGWYRGNYPDVDREIGEGRLENADEHYREFGWLEGRATNAKMEIEAQRWFDAIGAAAPFPVTTAIWENDFPESDALAPPRPKTRLELFFDAKKEGNGIWKWRHYFDIYDRHFRKFVGTEVHILEIGVYSGGSLEMWQDYFGPKARVYGVDVEEACTVYNRDGVEILIGDQEDRKFWHEFRERVPALDLVVDDGGHSPMQMMVTLEELLPHLRPGGVYLCEDIHGDTHPFASYVHGLAHKLNNFDAPFSDQYPERPHGCAASAFQEAVGSIHLYPYVAVIERNERPVKEFVAPRHGTLWQPFFSSDNIADPALEALK